MQDAIIPDTIVQDAAVTDKNIKCTVTRGSVHNDPRHADSTHDGAGHVQTERACQTSLRRQKHDKKCYTNNATSYGACFLIEAMNGQKRSIGRQAADAETTAVPDVENEGAARRSVKHSNEWDCKKKKWNSRPTLSCPVYTQRADSPSYKKAMHPRFGHKLLQGKDGPLLCSKRNDETAAARNGGSA